MNEEIYVPNENISWWSNRRRNRPQELAFISGILLMINSGLSIAWTLFHNEFNEQIWARDADIAEILVVQGGWFVGAIVGGFNAGYFIDSLGRRQVMRIAIGAQLIASIVLIFSTTSVVGLMFGRIIDGYGHGSAYLTLIVYSGEISTKYNRGILTSFVHLGIILGILLFTIINPFTVAHEEVDAIFIMGVICGVLSLISLMFNFFFSHESPVYLLQQEKDADALENMIKFRNERLITNDVREDFQKMQQMVARDKHIKTTIYKVPAFYFMLLLKFLFVATFNYPLNVTRIDIAKDTILAFGIYNFQSFILAILRVLIGITVMVTVDGIGRVPMFMWSIRSSAISLLILAIIYVSSNSNVVIIFNIMFEVFSSFGIAMIIDIYSTEVFTTYKKGIGLSLINAFENLLQLILVLVGIGVNVNYIFSYVILFVCAGILIIFSFMQVPETKKQSIHSATERFLGIKFGLQIW